MSKKQATGHETMTVKEVYKELEKSAPALYKKIMTFSSNESKEKFGPNEILKAIEKEAPHLYEKMKANNFKIQVDSETKANWQKSLDESKAKVAAIKAAQKK